MIDNNREKKELEKEKILRVYASRKKGFNLSEAAEYLNWGGKLDTLEDAVEELKREGRLINRGTRVVLPQNWNLIPAKISRLMPSFGFARRLDNGEEIFIPGRGLSEALPGDIVLLELIPQQGELAEGTVQRITVPAKFLFSGVYRTGPDGSVITSAKAFRGPVRVSSKGSLDAQDGERVLAKIVRRGESMSELRAAVVQRFGSSLFAKNCCEAVLASNGIERNFPAEAVEQAEELCRKGIHPKELESRLDLREQIIFTIDGADSKDLDDAVSIEKTEKGWSLGVHIADVSYYVTEKSPLDLCAFERGTSIYYADSVIPMLPKALSNGICSLNPMEDRLTLSCLMELSPEGGLLSCRFERTVIRSQIKGVYWEVNAILDGSANKELLDKYRTLLPSIQLMGELARCLIARRKQRGSLELNSSEPKFVLDDEGKVLDIIPRRRGLAEHMIEEFMLLANSSAAKFAREQAVPFVYRVHEEPAPDRLESLQEILTAMGINTPNLHRDSGSAALTAILDSVRGMEVEQLVNTALIRSMAKAKYSSENKGHFGLSLEDYAHFTSPIRRYPDLSIHRILSAKLLHMRPDRIKSRFSAFVKASAQQSSEMEVKAMTVERECEDCYKAEYMAGHIGEEFDGVISFASHQGIFVELPNTVEGLIRIEAMPEGEYEVIEQVQVTNVQSGRKFRIGDPLRVIVLAADVSSGRVDFGIPGVEPRQKQALPQPKAKKAKHEAKARVEKGKKGSRKKHPRKKGKKAKGGR